MENLKLNLLTGVLLALYLYIPVTIFFAITSTDALIHYLGFYVAILMIILIKYNRGAYG